MSLPFLVQRCLTCCLFFWGLLLSPGGFFHVPARPAPLAQLKTSLFCLVLFLNRFSRSISLFNSFASFIFIHSFLSRRVDFTRSRLLFDFRSWANFFPFLLVFLIPLPFESLRSASTCVCLTSSKPSSQVPYLNHTYHGLQRRQLAWGQRIR